MWFGVMIIRVFPSITRHRTSNDSIRFSIASFKELNMPLIKMLCGTIASIALLCFCSQEKQPPSSNTRQITDARQKTLTIDDTVNRVICSGSGCLRYLCYLQGVDKAVAVDDVEKRNSWLNTRPYALANPRLSTLPLFGQYRGFDNPELILNLPRLPQVIFKIESASGYDPDELQKKTGIPVVVIKYGDLTRFQNEMFSTLRLMGSIINQKERAEEVIAFFTNTIQDLQRRVEDIPESDKKQCYVGGIAQAGPHGFLSTEPGYEPFRFLAAHNVASIDADGDIQKRHMIVSKEKLLEWDPEIIFLDVSSTVAEGKASSIEELTNDPAFRDLRGRKNIYGVLPYNSYTTNFGSVLANAYYIGSILYPHQFADIDGKQKADEIYAFLVGGRVFAKINGMFEERIFTRIEL